MTTSQTTSALIEPAGEDPIPQGTLGYMSSRGRLKLHQAVLREFRKSGISQATLARRLRKKPEVISRLLASPGNWTADTAAQLLFAINGGEFEYDVAYPLRVRRKNSHGPDWFSTSVGGVATVQSNSLGETASSATVVVLTRPIAYVR